MSVPTPSSWTMDDYMIRGQDSSEFTKEVTIPDSLQVLSLKPGSLAFSPPAGIWRQASPFLPTNPVGFN